MIIKAGTILTLTYGEYSDRDFTGPFTVLRDFDQAEVVEAFIVASGTDPDHFMKNAFIAWLATEGYVEDVPNTWDWFIGSYGGRPDIDKEPA